MMHIAKVIMLMDIVIMDVIMLNVIGMVWIAKENHLKLPKVPCVSFYEWTIINFCLI
jgi:hypothetical protein